MVPKPSSRLIDLGLLVRHLVQPLNLCPCSTPLLPLAVENTVDVRAVDAVHENAAESGLLESELPPLPTSAQVLIYACASRLVNPVRPLVWVDRLRQDAALSSQFYHPGAVPIDRLLHLLLVG